ncbi:MAG: c-type cytochrome [Solirubrobacterales bacterium]
MARLSTSALRPRRLVGVAAAAVAAAAMAGCDVAENADLQNGQLKFTENCGSCHILAHAGSSGQIGPNLDAAFKQSRADGMTSNTIEGVVERQIAHPQGDEMPADLVTGDNAEDVATYVGQWAGVPGVEPEPTQQLVDADDPGAQVWANQGCASCHGLQAAGSRASVGPDLDESLLGKDAAYIRESIVRPNAVVIMNYARGVMPTQYSEILSDRELDELVRFIDESVPAD